MTNIREHVSSVTLENKDATIKEKALIAGAVRRVALHEPLEKKQVDVHPNVSIVGGGIAGIQAALTMAEAGKKVYLVERNPSIGGHKANFDKTFPTLDCSVCILTPKIVAVANYPNILLLTYSEVEDVGGYMGNFKVKIRKKARYVDLDKCTGCGDCWSTCPALTIPSQRVIRKGDLIIKERIENMSAPSEACSFLSVQVRYRQRLATSLSPMMHLWR